MTNGGPPAPQLPPVIPPAVPPAPPVQLPALPAQPNESAPMPQLNWSHFKPQFAGKPDEDVEAHHLRTNYWMDTHAFPEGVKVWRLCLMLVGEATLGYESLKPIDLDWNGLQDQFRQQYSKIGNTREQVISCMEIFPLLQIYRSIRHLCHMH